MYPVDNLSPRPFSRLVVKIFILIDHDQQMASMHRRYGHQQYYGMPPQYNTGAMPSPQGYNMPYQTYGRSPPPTHPYAPMMGVSVPQNYPRHYEQSPNLATSYQPPSSSFSSHAQAPSTHPSSMIPPPSSLSPPVVESASSQPAPSPLVASPVLSERPIFRPPLPWYSRPDLPFPKRIPRSRLRRTSRSRLKKTSIPPNSEAVSSSEQPATTGEHPSADTSTHAVSSDAPLGDDHNNASSKSSSPRPNEEDQNKDFTPESPIQTSTVTTKDNDALETVTGGADVKHSEEHTSREAGAPSESVKSTIPDKTPVKVAPSSWAKLFASSDVSAGKGADSETATSMGGSGSNLSPAHKSSLAEVIRSFRVDSNRRVSLIEPRGLINTGNMCYMNSVLQVLVFCTPFYDFLEQLRQKAAHSFKSETPLVDILVVFMQEFKVLASASTADKLSHIVRPETFGQFGEPFTPEFVYDAIRQLSRFASMEHGHQQDAEEFLGFLLQTLDDECTYLMNKSLNGKDGKPATGAPPVPNVLEGSEVTGDWLEVGPKQKAAVTRSSGISSSTPITKIFGGLLRSELRVPGLKDSITTEPYQPLQLDIGSSHIRNVMDALRGLTKPEHLHGDFNSPLRKDATAIKQVFIESLPPVLILHLKRFQFDAEGHGTVKIWKKIGYPLELDIPREVLSRQFRKMNGNAPMPRYKLISVVYHHGKNASGGHYTVDVRRQDGREWIRMDDTVLRRIHGDEVARIGSEEDAKDTHGDNSPAGGASANRYHAMNDENAGDEDGWKQVTASSGGNKKPNGSVNGTGKVSSEKKHINDTSRDNNKVAYLLFYQRM
ncbi:hypothetical protein E4U17_004565 [Claviceps sp. LM77 group G4]|nr:hypothetical protein E4U17_004565 [Claviceps sp. LM77 group G4]KAG6073105.1 hypothetical protein E4U16_004910 [Claviceps sp. LM84 group G4]